MSLKKAMKTTLTDEQKAVLLHGNNEFPFTGALVDNHEDGTYTCAGCDTTLFNSSTKYDSHSGWPSFYDALPGTVEFSEDTSHGMVRIEARCAACGGHLGHVFPDGPSDKTGLRYCISSNALEFQPINKEEK